MTERKSNLALFAANWPARPICKASAWMACAGCLSLGAHLGGLAVGADPPAPHTRPAAVQVTTAPDLRLRNVSEVPSAALEQAPAGPSVQHPAGIAASLSVSPTQPRQEFPHRMARQALPAIESAWVMDEPARPAAPGATDLSRRAALLGQQVRSQFLGIHNLQPGPSDEESRPLAIEPSRFHQAGTHSMPSDRIVPGASMSAGRTHSAPVHATIPSGSSPRLELKWRDAISEPKDIEVDAPPSIAVSNTPVSLVESHSSEFESPQPNELPDHSTPPAELPDPAPFEGPLSGPVSMVPTVLPMEEGIATANAPNQIRSLTRQPEPFPPSDDAEATDSPPALIGTNQLDQVRSFPEPAPDGRTYNMTNGGIHSPIQPVQPNATTNIEAQRPTSILPTPAVAAGPVERVAPASSWVIGGRDPANATTKIGAQLPMSILPTPAAAAGPAERVALASSWVIGERDPANATTKIGAQLPTSILPTPAVAARPTGRGAPGSSWAIGESNPTAESIRQFQEFLNQRFPARGIELEQVGGSLVVKGSAAGQREAIEIVSSVRDNYLVPVVDRLDVPRGRP